MDCRNRKNVEDVWRKDPKCEYSRTKLFNEENWLQFLLFQFYWMNICCGYLKVNTARSP